MTTEAGDHGRNRGVRRWLWVALAVLLAWPVLGTVTGQGADEPIDDPTPLPLIANVAVRDNFFDASALEVAPETTVVWTWEGRAPHQRGFCQPRIGRLRLHVASRDARARAGRRDVELAPLAQGSALMTSVGPTLQA
jgi:hypothetical protein